MESPFKFLDSYTKEDRDIFFSRLNYFCELPWNGFKSITPLQGLYAHTRMRWTMSIAKVLSAYSANNGLSPVALKEQSVNVVISHTFCAINVPSMHALKGLNIIEHDNVLLKRCNM